MNRWTTVRYRIQDELDDGLGAGGDGKDGEGTQSGSQTGTQGDQTPSDGQSPFEHPLLKGKSEAEIAELLSVTQEAARSQRNRIASLEQEVRNRPAAIVEEVDELAEVDSAEFFKEPVGNVRKIVEQVVGKQLKDIVGPLVRDIRADKSEKKWSSVAAKHPNFETYREAVEEQIAAFGISEDQLTSAVIEEIFFSKVGRAAIDGSFAGVKQRNGDGDGEERPARINPQHRPSSQPLRKGGEEVQKIELTEEEKRMARIQFKGAKNPEKAYIDWAAQGADHEDEAYDPDVEVKVE